MLLDDPVPRGTVGLVEELVSDTEPVPTGAVGKLLVTPEEVTDPVPQGA